MILTKVAGGLMPRILTKVAGRLMNNGSVLSCGVVAGFLLVVVSLAFPPPARAAWVNGGNFQVGTALRTITPPTIAPTWTCSQGTSLALVSGLKLAGV